MAINRVSAPTERPSVDGIGFFDTASMMLRTFAMPSSTVPVNGHVAAGMHAPRYERSAVSMPLAWARVICGSPRLGSIAPSRTSRPTLSGYVPA